MLPLVLSASKLTWMVQSKHGDEKEDPVLRAAVSKRFKHTCQYCGWIDEKYNEVSHLDEDHTNFKDQNLTLACPLCHQCLHLGQVTADGGKMIWAPEISQVQINHLARVSWMTERSKDHPLLISTRTLVSKLEHQTQSMEMAYGSGSADPGFWAELLTRLTPEQYEKRQSILENARLWPLPTKFKKMTNSWLDQTKINLPISDWIKLASPSEKHQEHA